MKKVVVLICLSLIFVKSHAQQDLQFTHFKEYMLYYNPAYAGVGNGVCGDLLGRNQWTGFDRAPESYFLDVRYSSPVLHGGLGLTIINDKLGFQKNTSVGLSYSFKKSFSNVGDLFVGMSIGYNRASWVGNFIPPESLSDPFIPISGQSAGMVTSNAGLFYRRKEIYMGLSATQLNQGVFQSVSSSFNYNTVRHYYVLAGFKKPIGNSLEVEPSIFAKSDAVSTQVDVCSKLILNRLLVLGVNYRLADAVSPMAGVNIYGKNSKLAISYSYDITTSQLRKYSSGSHEIAVSYCKLIIPASDRHVDPRNLGTRVRL